MKVLVNSLVWLALQGLENTMEVTTASYTPLEELLVEKLLVPLLGLLLVVQEPPHSRICLENSWELFWLLWATRLVIFLVL